MTLLLLFFFVVDFCFVFVLVVVVFFGFFFFFVFFFGWAVVFLSGGWKNCLIFYVFVSMCFYFMCLNLVLER